MADPTTIDAGIATASRLGELVVAFVGGGVGVGFSLLVIFRKLRPIVDRALEPMKAKGQNMAARLLDVERELRLLKADHERVKTVVGIDDGEHTPAEGTRR